MPNWCNTNYLFFSENKEQLESLAKSIEHCETVYKTFSETFRKTPGVMPSGWLGSLLVELGLVSKSDAENNKIPEELHCRGYFNEDVEELEIQHFDDGPEGYPVDGFTVTTESAWEPMTNMWKEILKRKFPDVKMYFVAEEGGNGYYVNTDKSLWYFKDEWRIDCDVAASDYEIMGVKSGIDGFYDIFLSGTVEDIVCEVAQYFDNIETIDDVFALRDRWLKLKQDKKVSEDTFIYLNHYRKNEIW